VLAIEEESLFAIENEGTDAKGRFVTIDDFGALGNLRDCAIEIWVLNGP